MTAEPAKTNGPKRINLEPNAIENAGTEQIFAGLIGTFLNAKGMEKFSAIVAPGLRVTMKLQNSEYHAQKYHAVRIGNEEPKKEGYNLEINFTGDNLEAQQKNFKLFMDRVFDHKALDALVEVEGYEKPDVGLKAALKDLNGKGAKIPEAYIEAVGQESYKNRLLTISTDAIAGVSAHGHANQDLSTAEKAVLTDVLGREPEKLLQKIADNAARQLGSEGEAMRSTIMALKVSSNAKWGFGVQLQSVQQQEAAQLQRQINEGKSTAQQPDQTELLKTNPLGNIEEGKLGKIVGKAVMEILLEHKPVPIEGQKEVVDTQSLFAKIAGKLDLQAALRDSVADLAEPLRSEALKTINESTVFPKLDEKGKPIAADQPIIMRGSDHVLNKKLSFTLSIPNKAKLDALLVAFNEVAKDPGADTLMATIAPVAQVAAMPAAAPPLATLIGPVAANAPVYAQAAEQAVGAK